MTNTIRDSGESQSSLNWSTQRLELVSLALILPLIAALLIIITESNTWTVAISATLVVATALLISIDAKFLGRKDRSNRLAEKPYILFIGLVLVWVLVYPLAFFRRARFGAPNLAAPGLLSLIVFMGGPSLYFRHFGYPLPSATSSEVVKAVNDYIRSNFKGVSIRSIGNYQEVSFDPNKQARRGSCVIKTKEAEVAAIYEISWHDRSKGLFQVTVMPADMDLFGFPPDPRFS
ncbi:MAG: hypothetical protein J5J00_09210 [Deltaproteobacteria bacterium]|nr:hypothetical protein [Deltaproteobacteria bacterium]